MSKRRPILFSGPMVRAILAGTKTQTRRVIKRWPPRVTLPKEVRGDFPFDRTRAPAGVYEPEINQYGAVSVRAWDGDWLGVKPGEFHWECSLGQPGDRLWVRETVRWDEEDVAIYEADGSACHRIEEWVWRRKVLPSIHMPRGASRITLEITDVRVDRVQEISEEDARTEGVAPTVPLYGDMGGYTHDGHKDAFMRLWDSLAKPGAKWDDNPFCWVIQFKRIEKGAADEQGL